MSSRIPIVVFAQIPPPEHGQSRMVLLALEALRQRSDLFDVHHINARFSTTLEDIGESSIGKFLLTTRYLLQAVRVRFGIEQPLLYYVPGPVKWSSVLRDWILLSILRILYPRVIFHWHAIGQGEWAHGSERLRLEGPRWVDCLARRISAKVLDQPYLSIPVTENSRKDSIAVASLHESIIPNGISDPCPNFQQLLRDKQLLRRRELSNADSPCFRILFLSHGTIDKGIIDALDCMDEALENGDPAWSFQITFAGGVSEAVRILFQHKAKNLLERYANRFSLNEEGYLKGEAKSHCLASHDLFLSPSRWESFGLTVIEAMAHGLPVVAAASDGVSGVLPPKYDYLAPVSNPEQLARKLLACCKAILNEPDATLPETLRMRVLDRFLIGDFSTNLVKVIYEVASPSPRALEPASGRAGPSRPAATSLPDLQPSTFKLSDFSSLPSPTSNLQSPISISIYLADQNPGHDRSFGISRMSQVVLESLYATGRVRIETIASKTSQQAPEGLGPSRVLPWGTRRKSVRLLTDHFHPMFTRGDFVPDLHYFPKGYLPLLSGFCRPSVVTIHDTIIQYDEDHYPQWRKPWEYAYWSKMLKHTLKEADRILTVSQSSKNQIESFMDRHGIPRKEITVTYEPCLYEEFPQPEDPQKENYVIHLASVEPHKRTAHLIRWWHEAERAKRKLPMLHLIGSVPPEVEPVLASSHSIVKRPFLQDSALQSAYLNARALVLPSEIEGFGLPALEAYYLGTPVCFVKGTSVEEVLSVVTSKGGFSLHEAESLFRALDEVIEMNSDEVRGCGLKLREHYAAEKVAERMMKVFGEVKAEKLKS